MLGNMDLLKPLIPSKPHHWSPRFLAPVVITPPHPPTHLWYLWERRSSWGRVKVFLARRASGECWKWRAEHKLILMVSREQEELSGTLLSLCMCVCVCYFMDDFMLKCYLDKFIISSRSKESRTVGARSCWAECEGESTLAGEDKQTSTAQNTSLASGEMSCRRNNEKNTANTQTIKTHETLQCKRLSAASVFRLIKMHHEVVCFLSFYVFCVCVNVWVANVCWWWSLSAVMMWNKLRGCVVVPSLSFMSICLCGLLDPAALVSGFLSRTLCGTEGHTSVHLHPPAELLHMFSPRCRSADGELYMMMNLSVNNETQSNGAVQLETVYK